VIVLTPGGATLFGAENKAAGWHRNPEAPWQIDGTFYKAKLPVGLWWLGRFLIQAGVVLRLPLFTALSARSGSCYVL
jgi:hypothetical protein